MTYARNAKSGTDEFFQFIIPKAKVMSENTITLEAEGDPSTFNMSLKVMRPDDGVMMKLVKYEAKGGTSQTSGSAAEIDHNHILVPQTLSASVSHSDTTTGVEVAISGLTSGTATSSTSKAVGTVSSGKVTVKAASEATAGDTDTLTVKDGTSTVKAIIEVSLT